MAPAWADAALLRAPGVGAAPRVQADGVPAPEIVVLDVNETLSDLAPLLDR